MAEAFYTPEELQAEADGAKRQPEFDPADREADPIDDSWDSMVALFEKHAEIQTVIDGITQNSEAGIVTEDTVSL